MATSDDVALIVLRECTVLGSSGFPFLAGESLSVIFGAKSVACRRHDEEAIFSLLELVDISITGPGTVTTGGGFIGGGFGVEGALGGIALAGVLNALTTKSKIYTFVTLTTNFGELHLHYGAMDPGALRIYLADIYARLRRQDMAWLSDRRRLIDSRLEDGSITADEANQLKTRLTAPPIWKDSRAEVALREEAQRLLAEKALNEAPQGICPSCDKQIPLASETCRFCKANFGQYASWKVLPLN